MTGIVWIGETIPGFVDDLWSDQSRDYLDEPMHIGEILAEIAHPTVGDPGTMSPTKPAPEEPSQSRALGCVHWLQGSEPVGADLRAEKTSGHTFPHPTPTGPGEVA